MQESIDQNEKVVERYIALCIENLIKLLEKKKMDMKTELKRISAKKRQNLKDQNDTISSLLTDFTSFSQLLAVAATSEDIVHAISLKDQFDVKVKSLENAVAETKLDPAEDAHIGFSDDDLQAKISHILFEKGKVLENKINEKKKAY